MVTHIVEQQGSVVECNGIVRLHRKHIIEVLDGQVVIAHLSTQQATVEMTQVVGRLQVERRIIIRHGTSQIVLIITDQRPVDI